MYNEELLLQDLSIIDSAHLAAFEHLRLKFFLYNAIDKDLACRFLLDVVTKNPEGSFEGKLRSILKNLHVLAEKFTCDSPGVSPELCSALKERQNNVCYVSGESGALKATYIVSPSIIDDNEIQPGGALRPTLEAWISPQMIEKLFLFLNSCNKNQEECLKNLWLMSSSASSAFRSGRISMFKNRINETEGNTHLSSFQWNIRKTIPGQFRVAGLPKNCTFSIQPSTPDMARLLPLPEGFLLAIHRPISAFNYYMSIEKEIQSGWQSYSTDTKTLGKFGQRILRGLFLVIPEFLKLKIAQLIVKAVNRWYPQDNPFFRYLPWGLYLKIGRRVDRNEANTLLLIDKMTSIPAPKLIGFTRDEKNNVGYLIMTVVPGVPADSVYYRMSYDERIQLAKDLGKHISEYRQIPNPHADYFICDTLGGPTTDHRTDIGKICGPYSTEDEFTNFLTEGLEGQRDKYPLRYLYEKHHNVCFTHSDLHLSNILVLRGKFSGLVDWESACFKPEYESNLGSSR
ncbi:hypothetical protein MauCBS54593_007414 [Microsporum audouinii]